MRLTPTRFAAAASVLLLCSACGGGRVQLPPDAGEEVPPTPALTSLSPDPGPFNGIVTVTLKTDVPATIYVTTDGSDPQTDSANRKSGEGTLTLELSQTTTLTFFSRTPEGAVEAVRTAEYLRAGGPSGTISGVIVVDTLAVNHAVALFNGNQSTDLGAVTKAQELPFTLTDQGTGTHRLRAMADLNDDGNFFPVVDLASDAVSVDLNLDDPFHASAENVRIYLGGSPPDLCTLKGVIKLPKPAAGETIRLSALSASAFGQGADPQALLSQLQNGYLIVVDPQKTEYPYAVTNLAPGSYVPVPALFSVGNGAFGINFLANPLKQSQCEAGQTVTANFEFGPVDLSGAVTLQPATPPTQNFVYGVVAGRSISLQKGINALLMPMVFAPSPTAGEFTGGYAGRALWSNSTFGLRAFTNVESQNPLLDSLVWTISVFGAAQPHATVQTTTVDATQDLTIALP